MRPMSHFPYPICYSRHIGEKRRGASLPGPRRFYLNIMSTKTRSVRRRPRTTPKRNTKHTGDLAEILFLVRAVERGLHLSKPFGDNDGYDWIVANQRNILRVQVKSTSTVVNGLYQVNSGRRTTARVVPYDPSEVDILAVLVVPENTWYIIP